MSDKTEVGKILQGKHNRDAVHFALAPVFASQTLGPAQPIELVPGTTDQVRAAGKAPIGIVDPFLKNSVRKGEQFYMFLYMNTVTGMRHEWEHPAFKPEIQEYESGGEAMDNLVAKAESEEWLKAFCETSGCPAGYEELMTVIKTGSCKESGDGDYGDSLNISMDGDSIHFSGRDAHGDIPPEFWKHVEIVLGHKPRATPAYFSCSC